MSYCVKIASLEYGNHRDPVMWKVKFEEKIRYFSLRKFNSVSLKARYCHNNLLSNFRSIIWQVIAYENKRKFQIVALKIIPVVYERWSLTKESLRIGDRLREVSTNSRCRPISVNLQQRPLKLARYSRFVRHTSGSKNVCSSVIHSLSVLLKYMT